MPQQDKWSQFEVKPDPWSKYEVAPDVAAPKALGPVVPHDDRSAAQVRSDQIGAAVQGLKDYFTAPKQAPPDLPPTFEEARSQITNQNGGRVGGLLNAVMEPGRYQGPVATSVRGVQALMNPDTGPSITREEWEAAAKDSSGLLMGSLMSKYGPAAISKVSQVATKPAAAIREYVPNRMMSSLIKPQESSFEFGKDPVAALNEAGVAGGNMKGVVTRAKAALGQTETELKAVTQKYSGNYDDVAPVIRKAASAEAEAARLDGKTGLAKQIMTMAENRIKAVEGKYGSTRLNPDQIREVKGEIGGSTNFTPEAKEMSLNRAKMRIYSGLDRTMDFMTGNETAPINQRYASLMEGTRLLELRQDQMMKSPVVGGTFFNSTMRALGKVFPEAGLKTGIAQLTRDRFAMPEVNPQTHSPLSQAFRPPVVESPGSYPTQGLGDVVEGGTYRVTEPGTGTHPASLSNAAEGGQYRVSEPATGTHPTQLSIIKDGGTYRIVETATGTHPTSLVNATEGGQYKISEPATGTHPSQLTSAKEGGTYRVAEPATGTYPTQAYGEAREAPVMTGKSTIRPVLQYGTDQQTGARIPIAVIDAATGRIIRKLQ